MDQQAADQTSAKKRILIVEDNDILSNVYVRRLEMEGFDVVLVPSGQDALAKAQHHKPDLILLDLMLPDKNGLDVLHDLRSAEDVRDTTIFVFSAIQEESLQRAHDEERARIKREGADKYFVKSRDMFDDVIAEIKTTLSAD